MNLVTSSPILVVLYVGALLWILMDVPRTVLRRAKAVWVLLALLAVGVGNHLLRVHMGAAAYAPWILLTLHLPFFFLFRLLTRCGVVKMLFMIFTGVVFSAPVVHVSNIVRGVWPGISAGGLLLSNLLTYALLLVLAQTAFRKGFNHFIKYADNRLAALFSLIPLLYFIYMFAAMNVPFPPASFGSQIARLMPTAFAMASYFLMMRVYSELQEKRRLDVEALALKESLNAAGEQMEQMRRSAHQTAVYHHDMRHHLQLISSFLSSGKNTEAMAYIHRIQEEVDSVQPRRFCQHEAVNLLCSSFTEKAQRMEVELTVDASLPQDADIPDTELCSLLSNGLENALHAAAQQEQGRRWVRLYCTERSGNLLLEIRNPYTGTITLRDGIPTSDRPEHGYGCLSIAAIAQRRRGHCQFLTEEGIFTLRVAIPL